MDVENNEILEYRNKLKRLDEEGRIEAYREIGYLSIPEGNVLLVEGLSDRSPRVRSIVSKILTEIADEKVVQILLRILRHDDPGIRSRAMNILAQLGTLTLGQVEAYRNDPDPDVRIFVANVLGNTGLSEAFPFLKEALQDPEENVRYSVVEAMGKIGVKEAIPLLLAALEDEWVRYPAIEALGLLEAREAIPHLRRIYEEDEWVRHAVIEAFGNIGDASQVDFLIEQMHTNNEMILHDALTALTRIERVNPTGAFDLVRERGIDIETVIVSALGVYEPEVRKSAIWSLGQLGNENHLTLLLAQLADFDEAVCEASRQALLSLGGRHLGALLDLYRYQDEPIRQKMIEIFGSIGDRTAIPTILSALDDENDRTREIAAGILAVFKDSSVVDSLIMRLADRSPHVRSAGVCTLGALKAVKATRYLMPLLEDLDADVRESASEALGKIGTGEIASKVSTLLRHLRMDVRQAAIQCLGLIVDRRANNSLIEALSNSERGVRRFAAGILGKRHMTQAVGPLINALLDEDWQVRKSAASALGNLRDPRSVDALLASLEDENMWVRYAAVLALGKMGARKAEPSIRRHLNDDKVPVRVAAIEALRAMKVPDLFALLQPLRDNPDEEIRKVVAVGLEELSIRN